MVGTSAQVNHEARDNKECNQADWIVGQIVPVLEIRHHCMAGDEDRTFDDGEEEFRFTEPSHTEDINGTDTDGNGGGVGCLMVDLQGEIAQHTT